MEYSKLLYTLIILTFLSFYNTNYTQGRIIDQIKITADTPDKERFDRIALDIKVDSWLKTPNKIKTKMYSIGVSAYIYKDIPLNKKSNLAFAYGIGICSDNIHHNGTFKEEIINNNMSFTKIIPYNNSEKAIVNKITLNYIEVPFEIRFRTMNKSLEERRNFNFRFYPGFKIGYQIGNHTKLVTKEKKIKIYRTPNALLYRYGPTIRIGFNKISFIAFYSLTSIFEKDKGEELNTLSIGISWLRF